MSGAHVDDRIPELLLGVLPTSARAEVETHLGQCSRCSREVASFRELLGDIGAGLPALAPPPDVRSHLLGASGGEHGLRGFTRRFARLFDLDETASDVVLAAAHGRSSWESFVPGVELFHFVAGPSLVGVDAGLVRFAPGLVYPSHTHLGEEIMFLLEGALREHGTGKELQAGDVHVMAEGTSHAFTIDARGPCLAAVLLRGGLPVFDDPGPSLRASADAPRCVSASRCRSDRPGGVASPIEGGSHVSEGERIVHCKKLDKDLPGVRRRPYKNELGEKIWNEVSQEAWEMWLKDSVKLINTYRVDLASAEGQKFMLKQAAVYFGFEQGDIAETAWTPPKEG